MSLYQKFVNFLVSEPPYYLKIVEDAKELLFMWVISTDSFHIIN